MVIPESTSGTVLSSFANAQFWLTVLSSTAISSIIAGWMTLRGKRHKFVND